MTSIVEDFRNAELALAAYADLAPGISNTQSLIDAGMSSSQATHFAATYTVIDQYNHADTWTYVDEFGHEIQVTGGNGLSATVFEDKTTHQRYLAIRGTDDLYDFATDLVDVAALGGTKYQSQYQALKAQVSAWQADGTLPDGIRPGQQQYTVTGHSLGGFLAAALTSDFAGTIGHTYLYNAPGFGGNALLGMNPLIGIVKLLIGSSTIPTLDASKISNVKADAGISPIAGLGTQVAPPIWISIENQLASDVHGAPAAMNHSQQVLTDALAVYDLFACVVPSITIDTISYILKAATDKNADTLESATKALGKIFLGTQPSITTGDRDALYQAIGQIKTVVDTLQALGETYTVRLMGQSADGDAALAKTDLAVRYALKELLPFAVQGKSYDSYRDALSLYDPASGQGETWLPMSLSQLYESVRHRRREGRGGAQASDHAGQIEAPVEAVCKFCEVARQMLGADRPVGAMHSVLDVAQHRIDPDERFAVLPPLRPARNERFVGTARLLDGVKASQAIGANMSASLQVLAAPAADLPAAKPFDAIHAHRQGFAARRIGRYSSHERRLAPCAAPALVAAAPSAPVSIVHLNDAIQRAPLLPFQHRLHELVLHEPGAVVADAQLPGHLQGRDSVLRLRQQIDPQQPLGQRQLGAGEQRPSRQRSLPAAAVALVEPAPKHAMTFVPTLRTDEALRPAPGKQGLLALRLGSVLGQEIAQTHAFLKLHLVPRHRLSPREIKRCQFAAPTGSQAEPHA